MNFRAIPLKVICAGYGKTGSKSIAKAFRYLGFTVFDGRSNEMFDFLDHCFFLNRVKPEVKWVYQNAVVCVYMWGCFLFEEILESFPEYKVIMSVREEDSWIESLARQLEFIHATQLRSNIVSVLSTTARKMHYVLDSILTATSSLQSFSVCVLIWR